MLLIKTVLGRRVALSVIFLLLARTGSSVEQRSRSMIDVSEIAERRILECLDGEWIYIENGVERVEIREPSGKADTSKGRHDFDSKMATMVGGELVADDISDFDSRRTFKLGEDWAFKVLIFSETR